MWQPERVHPLIRTAAGLVAGTAAAGAACVAYGTFYEVGAYRLRRFDVPVLPPGSRPLRLLHVSDLHLTPNNLRLVNWTRGLAALEPDLVVNTGDNLAHADAVPTAVDALAPLLELPGVFVFGSNDYYAPVRKNPLRYLRPRRGPVPLTAPPLPTEDLRLELTKAGWLDLNNAHGELTVDDRRLAFTGVDDPHVGFDRYAELGPPPADAELAIGITHAPYRRILDAMSADRHGLLLAGHTHGGQVCLPLVGALVSNCDLDAGRIKGLSRYAASWLHVSAGLGTSPYAPYRFACFPEASLLTLRAVDD